MSPRLVNRLVAPEWSWMFKEARPFALHQAASLVCIIASTACAAAEPLLMKWLIDDALGGDGGWTLLATVTGLFMVVMVGKSALHGCGNVFSALAVQRMVFRTRTRLLRHVQSLSASFHTQRSVGELVQSIERDVTVVGELGSEVLPTVARTLIALSMTLTVMLYLDWGVALILVPLLPCLGYLRLRYRGILQRGWEDVRQATVRQSSMLHEMLTGVIQIQLLGAEDRLARRYARLSLRTMHHLIMQRRHELMFAMSVTSVIGLGVALIVGYGGSRVLRGNLTTGGLVAFYGCVASLFAPMSAAVDMYARLNKARVSIRRLMEIEKTPEMVRDLPGAVPLAAAPRRLACRGVGFHYGPDKPALHRVDLNVVAGERVAIVGESGCGKSSLLKLIPRLYEPTHGHLELDGSDVRSIPLRSLRAAISLVPQDPLLFRGTLRENLWYASPNATPDEIARAAWIACLTPVVDRLPRGWNTELGPMGVGLSGGERQRLSIARALLQERPILVLDEATSALDDATECQLLSRLSDWASGRIVIVVSHRMAAACWADRVIVLYRGEIVEDGPHDVLVRSGSRYRALWHRGALVGDNGRPPETRAAAPV